MWLNLSKVGLKYFYHRILILYGYDQSFIITADIQKLDKMNNFAIWTRNPNFTIFCRVSKLSTFKEPWILKCFTDIFGWVYCTMVLFSLYLCKRVTLHGPYWCRWVVKHNSFIVKEFPVLLEVIIWSEGKYLILWYIVKSNKLEF